MSLAVADGGPGVCPCFGAEPDESDGSAAGGEGTVSGKSPLSEGKKSSGVERSGTAGGAIVAGFGKVSYAPDLPDSGTADFTLTENDGSQESPTGHSGPTAGTSIKPVQNNSRSVGVVVDKPGPSGGSWSLLIELTYSGVIMMISSTSVTSIFFLLNAAPINGKSPKKGDF